MAGLLSKGITLGYKGVGCIMFDHKFVTAASITGGPNDVVLHLLTTTPEPLIETATPDPSVLVGATVEGNENYNGCTIVGASYDSAGDCIRLYCSEGECHEIDVTLVSEETTVVAQPSDGDYSVLTNLQEIAEIGNNTPEKIDVTVLSDSAKKSISGLKDTAQDLAFKFLYEKAQFNVLAALVGSHEWRVTLPDGTTATFDATPSVKLAGVGVSAALTYTLTLSVESEIVFA